jgi:hypothetical protein
MSGADQVTDFIREPKKAREKLTFNALSSVGMSQARDVCVCPYSLCHVWAVPGEAAA